MIKNHKSSHRYKHATIGKAYQVYRCTLKGCTHYQPVGLMVGASFICANCGDESVIETKDDLLEELKCMKCRKQGNVTTEKVIEVLENLVQTVREGDKEV